jgi:hypothetical protein
MAEELIAGLPPDLELAGGYIIRLAAVDPTTGAAVSGVKVSDVSVFGTPLADTTADNLKGPFTLVAGPAG